MHPSSRYLLLFTFCLFIAASTAEAQQSTEVDVTYKSTDVTLAGTIFRPRSEGPHPGLVITHGSERGSRRGRGYRHLGAELSKLGFMVLIYDKRGVGDSEGEYQETPYMDVAASDVLAGVALLKQQAQINPQNIGVLGFSQGGWVGPLAATKSEDVAFVVSLVGPGVSIREQVLFHRSNQWRDKGWNAAHVDELVAFSRDLYTYLGTGNGYAELKPRYEEATQQPWFEELRAMRFGDALPEPHTLGQTVFNFFRKMKYDPRPTLEQMRVPLLAIFGTDDQNVPTGRSVAIMQAAFQASGNPDLTIHVFEDVGHNMWQRDVLGLKPQIRRAIWQWLEEIAQRE